MSVYDIVMLIIFLGSVWFGFRKGLAWQVASLLSIVLSYFVAVNFRNPVAALISAQEPWNQFAAMLILFLGTSLVVWTVFASFSRNIKKLNLGGFDRQAGAILGGVKGGILCMLATVFAVSLFQPTRNMVHNSKAGYYVVSGIRQFARFTPSELVPYLEPHYQNFDSSIGATPVKQPLFSSGTNGQNYQVNQDRGFQNFPTSPSSNNGFSNASTDFGQPSGANPTSGQFQSPWQQSNNGQGFNRETTNPNFAPNTPYSQNLPNNQTQPNSGNFLSTGFGRQSSGQTQQPPVGNNGQFFQQQQTRTQPLQNRPLQNGFGQPQQQSVTVGQNGWPEINTTINTKDVIQRGVETTADLLRRAYDSNAQPR